MLCSWRTIHIPCIAEILFKLMWYLCIHIHWKGSIKILEHKSFPRKIGIVLLSVIADNASEFVIVYFLCNEN